MTNIKKYTVKHTSIMHNGSLVKEGGIIELTDAQAAKLADFVTLVIEPKTTNNNKQNSKSANNKQNKTNKQENTKETNPENGSIEEDKNGGEDNGK